MDIKQTVNLIGSIFHQVSGLGNFEEQVCAYYCLSTWFLNQINPFPILNITGPNGTGKSRLLEAFDYLAFQPYRFTGTDMTAPVIRDELGKAHERTALIEEADRDNLEPYLNMRYMRETAMCAKKIPGGIGAWKTVYIPIYGPSILHKRIPCKDAALEGRSTGLWRSSS